MEVGKVFFSFWLIFQQGLDKVVQATQADLDEEFQENIFDKYGIQPHRFRSSSKSAALILCPDSAIAAATGQADKIALKWGSRVNYENRAEGGYCWSTYKVSLLFREVILYLPTSIADVWKTGYMQTYGSIFKCSRSSRTKYFKCGKAKETWTDPV